MDEINLIYSYMVPLLTMVVTIFTTVYTVNKRVANEKKETHKPYLVLSSVNELKTLDKKKYYLTINGKKDTNTDKIPNPLPIEIVIKNIGYGVATNVRFFNLLTAEPIEGTQEISFDHNQKLFTTLDFGVEESKKIQAKLIDLTISKEHQNRILCVYKDLNEHTYSFILSINMKDEDNYDFFSYQPASRSYKRWKKENIKQYRKIIKQYKER